jgi:hypothetical protein
MNYAESVQQVAKEHDGIRNVANLMESLSEGDRVLVFSHDDPDGYGAAGILCRYLDDKNIEYQLDFPHRFGLTGDELEEALEDFGEVDAVFITDKGTLPHYDDLTDLTDPIAVVDHHPSDDYPDECVTYNPAEATCGGHQLHQLVTLANDYEVDEFDDWLALLALRSDWIIQPLRDVIPEFVEPFYEEMKDQWPHLLEPIEERPTWMEIDQRKQTLLVNQISELFFALSGGAFQYFYNDRIPALSDRDQTQFGFEVLMESAEQGPEIGSVESFEGYLESLPETDTVQAVFDEFLGDWETAMEQMETTMQLKKMGSIDFHIYVGEETPLMPLVGSVQLGKLADRNEEGKAAIIMVNRKLEDDDDVNIHFSFRSTGGGTHMGNIAGELAERIQAEYDGEEENTGGGHPPAAEMTVRSDGIEPLGPTRILLDLLDELGELADLADRDEINGEQRETAQRLGLSYLAEDEETVH